MAPKSRRSGSLWYFCESCKVTLSQRDLTNHNEGSCPPLLKSWTHGYIKDNIMYGILEEIKSDDILKHIPKSEYNNMVFLSEPVFKLCDICIGDSVIIIIKGISTVKTAWPTSEKSLVSALMTKEAIDFCWGGNYDNHIIVKKLLKEPLPAKVISVKMIKHLDISITDFIGKLERIYQNKILKTGDRVCIRHYGLEINLLVKEILPFEATTHIDENVTNLQLSEDLRNLSILETTEDIDETCLLFRIIDGTTWNIEINDHKESNENNTKNYSLSSIGGMQNVIDEANEIIDLALKNSHLISGLPVVRGILLYGVPGTGKTMLAEALAAESKATVMRINGAEIYSKFLGETENKLRQIFRTAKEQAPSIILLDEVDALCPKRVNEGGGGSDHDKRVVTTLLTLLDGLHQPHKTAKKTNKNAVLVIATTSKPDSLHTDLRRPGRLDREIEINVPSPDERLDILHKLLSATLHELNEEELKKVAFLAHGFVGADLASLCSSAAMHAVKKVYTTDAMSTVCSASIKIEDLSWALTQVKPSAMREVLIEVPNVRWSDIGGQHDLKLKLRQTVEWPLKCPEAFTRLGISPLRGILMYGPPGCSKTMIAKALATESKLNFISIKGPELFSKWVGESEKAVRKVFHKARQVAPAIVFFDELDALAGERTTSSGSGGSNVQERVLAQLLTELDGVEALGNVTVVGATNRPDRIDKALLRPGRLDRVIYVPLPDNITRKEILEIQLKKMPIACGVNIDELVNSTEGYSGAEILAVCHEAALKALEEDLKASEVTQNHFITALQLVSPRTPASLLELYESYMEQH